MSGGTPRTNATYLPSGESRILRYSPSGPAVANCFPDRSNHTSCERPDAPARYTTPPACETDHAPDRPRPLLLICSAIGKASPDNSSRLTSKDWHQRAVTEEEEMTRREVHCFVGDTGQRPPVIRIQCADEHGSVLRIG